ncbi:MAG TPA: VCBS repeat-containing protein, partial [Chryseolinea sp.]|nr:VCBS repeat-containing protein [Chryseolinea sp.]
MIRFIIFIGLMIMAEKLTAQVAERSVSLPDSIVQADPEWVDLDNDGLLDIMLLMKSLSGNYIGIIKGDTINPLVLNDKSTSIISYGAYLVADYNRDNTMDVVVSGEKNGLPVTAVYINKGEFGFEEIFTTLPPFSKARFADLDNDALPELIVTAEDQGLFYTRILKQDAEYSWHVANDSLKMKCTAIETLDADGDGDLDLYLSGKIKSDSLLSGFLINEGNFYFKPKNILALIGNASSGDFNGDGFFDIVLMGEDTDGKWHAKQIQHTAASYSVEDLPIEIRNGNTFAADFNSDGATDLQLHGLNAVGDTINTIRFSNRETLLLTKSRLVSQRFGDREHDGDLDFLFLIKKDFLSLILMDNIPPQDNLGPDSPKNAVALPVFNRLFMYWDKPADDHTPVSSLTYDVFLNGVINYQAGEFDLLNEKRLTVTHGNNGTENFRLLKIEAPGIAFSIQAVDNAFHASRPCIGQGGACTPTVTTQEINACSNENVVLESPPNVLWFSFADGYLGKADNFNFSSEKGDTVFYYNPKATGCAALKAWSIKINNDTVKVEKSEKYACENGQLQFYVEWGWNDIQWSSNLYGNLGSSDN